MGPLPLDPWGEDHIMLSNQTAPSSFPIKFDYIFIRYVQPAKDGGTDVPIKQLSLRITMSSTKITAQPFISRWKNSVLFSRSIDSQGLVGMAAYVSPILLFTSLDSTQGEINTALWQVSKQPASDIYWCRGPAALPSPFTRPEFRFLPSQVTPSPGLHNDIYPHLLLPLSAIRVAGSLIDVEPNGFWKRPFRLGCWHCCSDKMIKLLVGDKRRQGWNIMEDVGQDLCTVSLYVCKFVSAVFH